eukprot:scaffold45393_cov60-Phaeocystis_antarctica.AAC.2
MQSVACLSPIQTSSREQAAPSCGLSRLHALLSRHHPLGGVGHGAARHPWPAAPLGGEVRQGRAAPAHAGRRGEHRRSRPACRSHAGHTAVGAAPCAQGVAAGRADAVHAR